MSNPLDNLFSPGAKAIRRSGVFKATADADGNVAYESIQGEVTTLSQEGSIDSAQVIGFLHCGHSAQDGLGGQCGEGSCENVSCKHCFEQSRCSRCFKPLCLEHLRKLNVAGAPQPFCGRCADMANRALRWRALGQALLKPFVSTKEEPRS